MDLLKNIKVTTALNYASGTADRNGAILDMANYEGVICIVKLATIAAGGVNSIKWQQDTAVGMGTAADLEGTGMTIAADDDDQIFVTDLYRPAERYVRIVVDKDASNACAESAIYIQYGAKELPIDNSVTDLVTAETHVSPAEGTA